MYGDVGGIPGVYVWWCSLDTRVYVPGCTDGDVRGIPGCTCRDVRGIPGCTYGDVRVIAGQIHGVKISRTTEPLEFFRIDRINRSRTAQKFVCPYRRGSNSKTPKPRDLFVRIGCA